jgi:hypothetical protein
MTDEPFSLALLLTGSIEMRSHERVSAREVDL